MNMAKYMGLLADIECPQCGSFDVALLEEEAVTLYVEQSCLAISEHGYSTTFSLMPKVKKRIRKKRYFRCPHCGCVSSQLNLEMITDPLLKTQIEALYKEGWNPEDIADELGLDEVEVMDYCAELL